MTLSTSVKQKRHSLKKKCITLWQRRNATRNHGKQNSKGKMSSIWAITVLQTYKDFVFVTCEEWKTEFEQSESRPWPEQWSESALLGENSLKPLFPASWKFVNIVNKQWFPMKTWFSKKSLFNLDLELKGTWIKHVSMTETRRNITTLINIVCLSQILGNFLPNS